MQLTYNFNPSVGVEGMIAESREGDVVVSKIAQGVVQVGLLCGPGTDSLTGPSATAASITSADPGQVINFPGSVNSPLLPWEFVGIPIYDASRPPYDATNSYSDKDPVPVLRKGTIWVKPEAPFTDEKRLVYVRGTVAAPPLNVLGRFAGTAGAGLVLLPNARWMSGCSDAGLAILEIW